MSLTASEILTDAYRYLPSVHAVRTPCALEHYPRTAARVCTKWGGADWNYSGDIAAYFEGMRDNAEDTEPQIHLPIAQEMLEELKFLSALAAAREE